MENVLVLENNFEKKRKIVSTLLYGEYDSETDFTIVIPVYGKGRFLKFTLDSIKNMNVSSLKFQVIISNNKSDDDNESFIEFLKEYDSLNIIYFNSIQPLGQLANFNRAVELAKTDYVAMIHDDDLIVQNYMQIIELLLPWLRKNKKVGMISSKNDIFYTEDFEIEKKERCKKIFLKRISKRCITHYGITLTGIPSCGMVFNRKAFMENGGFNLNYPSSGDAFLAGVMIENGYKIYSFGTKTGYYRIVNNISLKPDICKGFIIEDYKFNLTWCRKNIFRRIHLLIFSRYVYCRSIEQKVGFFSKMNKEITIGNLDFRGEYKKYSKFSLIKIAFIIEGKIVEGFRKVFKIRIK